MRAVTAALAAAARAGAAGGGTARGGGVVAQPPGGATGNSALNAKILASQPPSLCVLRGGPVVLLDGRKDFHLRACTTFDGNPRTEATQPLPGIRSFFHWSRCWHRLTRDTFLMKCSAGASTATMRMRISLGVLTVALTPRITHYAPLAALAAHN